MKKYNKKIALILALALTLALAIPALAAQTEINGSYFADGSNVISVGINSTSVSAIINPNGYTYSEYEVGADGKPTDKVLYSLEPSGNITTNPIAGVNLGTEKVKVKATVTSILNGKFKFASSAPKETATTTTGLVFLEAKDVTEALGEGAAFDEAKVRDAVNTWNKAAEARDKVKDYTKTKKNNIVVLKKGTATVKDSLCSVDAGKYFIAHLSGYVGKGGDASKGKAWAPSDGFNATVVWSFETDTSSAAAK